MVRQAHHEGVFLPLWLVGFLGRQFRPVQLLVAAFAGFAVAFGLRLGSAKFLAIDAGLDLFGLALLCLAKFVKVDEVAHGSSDGFFPDQFAAGIGSGIDWRIASRSM